MPYDVLLIVHKGGRGKKGGRCKTQLHGVRVHLTSNSLLSMIRLILVIKRPCALLPVVATPASVCLCMACTSLSRSWACLG